MEFTNWSTELRELFYGNMLLIVCSVFYLAWWIVAFRPGASTSTIIKSLLLIAAVIAGVAGLILLLVGINNSSATRSIVPSSYLLWGGVILYALAFVITALVLKRQVTTELLLIIGWAVLELSVLNVLYGAGQITWTPAIVLCVVIGIAAAASLVCYVLYYRLEGTAGYIDGMIPLITEILVMVGVNIIMTI